MVRAHLYGMLRLRWGQSVSRSETWWWGTYRKRSTRECMLSVQNLDHEG